MRVNLLNENGLTTIITTKRKSQKKNNNFNPKKKKKKLDRQTKLRKKDNKG